MDETILVSPRQALHILLKKYPTAQYQLSQIIVDFDANEIKAITRCPKNTLDNPFCIETFDSEGNHIMHECTQKKKV
jgi:hypothetical protein